MTELCNKFTECNIPKRRKCAKQFRTAKRISHFHKASQDINPDYSFALTLVADNSILPSDDITVPVIF